MIDKKEEAALLAQNDPKVKPSPRILSDFSSAVKRNDLRTALDIADMGTREAANLLKPYFPKLDKTIISKCCAPDKYGCILHPDGFYAIGLVIGVKTGVSDDRPETPQKPTRTSRHGNHKFTCRVAGRLPDDKFLALQRYIRMEGYETTQDWVVAQVDSYLKEMEKKYV